MSVSWGFIFIVVGWKGDYKVVETDSDTDIYANGYIRMYDKKGEMHNLIPNRYGA